MLLLFALILAEGLGLVAFSQMGTRRAGAQRDVDLRLVHAHGLRRDVQPGAVRQSQGTRRRRRHRRRGRQRRRGCRRLSRERRSDDQQRFHPGQLVASARVRSGVRFTREQKAEERRLYEEALAAHAAADRLRSRNGALLARARSFRCSNVGRGNIAARIAASSAQRRGRCDDHRSLSTDVLRMRARRTHRESWHHANSSSSATAWSGSACSSGSSPKRTISTSPCCARSRAPPTTACSCHAFFSGKTRRGSVARADRTSSSGTASTLHLARSAPSRSTAQRKRRHDLDRARRCPTTSSCSRPAPIRSCRRFRAATAPDCFVYRTIEDLEAIRAAAATQQGRRRHRRRPAGPRSRQGAEGPRPRDACRRVRAAPDGGAGRRRRRPRAAPEDRGARRRHPHRQEHDRDRRRRDSASHACSSRTARRSKPTWSCSPPASARAMSWRAQRGLAVGERGGIVIDDRLPHLRSRHLRDRRVRAVERQDLRARRARLSDGADVCAARLLGRDEPSFTGADMSTKLKLLGVDVASLGDAHVHVRRMRAHTRSSTSASRSTRSSSSARTARACSAAFWSATPTTTARWLQMMLERHAAAGAARRDDRARRRRAAKKARRPASPRCPPSAQICSCNNVSKGAICAAIDAGCTTLGALKNATKAATSCGGCASLVTQILKAELASRGVAVNNHLCEHFPYSRQQLFHLVRVGELQVVRRRARQARPRPGLRHLQAGRRVDPGLVLERVRAEARQGRAAGHQRLLPRQHAEGRHLLVVPRVPGGEITPDKLIVHRRGREEVRASTRRSPAASASTCSARRSTSCR